MCAKYNIVLTPVWVPRKENQLADYLSKLTDVDDWGIQPHIFQWVTILWGPFTIDRFATWYNTKCNRFNSRFWNPGCKGIDAFSLNWQGEKLGKQLGGALIKPNCKGLEAFSDL